MIIINQFIFKKIRLKVYENENSEIARSYNNIGRVYAALGNKKTALEYF